MLIAQKRRRFFCCDDLTGLPDRYVLGGEIDRAIAGARQSGRAMAVLYVDLDRFKVINDTLGYEVGDEVLAEAAERLRNALGADDFLARLGGDEFVVVLEGLDKEDEGARLSGNILDAFRRPFYMAGNEFYVTASIGAASCTGICESCSGNCRTGSELLRRADLARLRAKDGGRNQFRVSERDVSRWSVEKMALEADLHRALERGEFVLHYQPKVALATGRVCGAEALVRWEHPVRGRVPPLDFIPILEESGLIVPVGEWIIRAACEQAAHWQRMGIGDVRIAINISPWQFQDEGLVATLADNLLEYDLSPAALEVEITESLLMQNPENAARIMQEMRDLGIVVSIDDFGTGYSSLAYLKRFPVDYLKIDRAFVKGLPEDESDAAICRAVLQFAAALGIEVVAEGVETTQQAEFLLAHDCNEMQGYLFSPPLTASDMEVVLAEGRRLVI